MNKKKKVFLKHHSISDWDFQSGSYAIDTAVYRSAPSSLRYFWTSRNKFVCNYIGTINLPQGRITGWFRKSDSTYERIGGFCCRIQYPNWDQGYWVNFTFWDGNVQDTSVLFYKDNVLVRSDSITALPINTWVGLRLTWWNSGPYFILRIEKFDGVNWIKLVPDYVDHTPLYRTSSVNRCGVAGSGHNVSVIRVDDITVEGLC